jgi:hypothetical protein
MPEKAEEFLGFFSYTRELALTKQLVAKLNPYG